MRPAERECAPLYWQRLKACPIYPELVVFGEYGYRRNAHADEDDRGGTRRSCSGRSPRR